MQIKQFDDLRAQLLQEASVRVVLAGIGKEELHLAHQAYGAGLASFTLIGNQKQVEVLAQEAAISLKPFELVHAEDDVQAVQLTLEQIHSGKGDIPMKGHMHTAIFMGAVLDKKRGLKPLRRVSQITVFQDARGRFRFLTDCAVNHDLTITIKKDIIENAVILACSFGYDTPKVALLGAVETVSEQMPDTLDSAVLTQMNRRGQIKNCIVDGPLSLDNAISENAARQKQIVSPVAGKADILVGSSLQESNTLSKSLHFYGNLPTASVLMGTENPFIMTSRTDDMENKLNSIAATCFFYHHTLFQ